MVNYYSLNDPLLMIDQRAGKLAKGIKNETFQEVVYAKHNTSFIFLKPKSNNFLLDHSMEGETYRIGLMKEAEDYKRRKLEIIRLYNEDKRRESDFIRKIRKLSANITGLHNFFHRKPNFADSHKSVVARIGNLTSIPYKEMTHILCAKCNNWLRQFRKKSAKITRFHHFFSGNVNNMLGKSPTPLKFDEIQNSTRSQMSNISYASISVEEERSSIEVLTNKSIEKHLDYENINHKDYNSTKNIKATDTAASPNENYLAFS
jgi:hypothetical protein